MDDPLLKNVKNSVSRCDQDHQGGKQHGGDQLPIEGPGLEALGRPG